MSDVRVQFASFRGSFAGRSLHEVLVFAKGAFPNTAVQGLAFRLERATRLFPVRLTFVGQERGAVFGVTGLECPKRIGLVIPTVWR